MQQHPDWTASDWDVAVRGGLGRHSPDPKGQGCLFLLGALCSLWLEVVHILEDQFLQPLLGEIAQRHVEGEQLLSHWLICRIIVL